MNYTTRQPAHSWEDTLPPVPPPHSCAPLPSPLALPSPGSLSCSFLTPVSCSPPSNPILSRSSLHLQRMASAPLPRCLVCVCVTGPAERGQRCKQGLPERCCSQVNGGADDMIKSPPPLLPQVRAPDCAASNALSFSLWWGDLQSWM